MKCTAKRTNGEPCRAWAMPNGKCRVHGGRTPSGLASPHFRTGRYSKHLPERLLERYKESLADPEILDLRSEISLLDARLVDVLKRADTGEAGMLWKQLRDTMRALTLAQRAQNVDAMKAHLAEMQSLVARGVADEAAWHEIGSLIDQRRKLVESERRRLVELQQTMTAEQAMVLVTQLSTIVRQTVYRHCADSEQARRILTDISMLIQQRLVNSDPGRTLHADDADDEILSIS